MRDSQKGKLFKWERRFQNDSCMDMKNGAHTCKDEMPLKECEKLVKTVAKYYGVKPPKVTDGRGCRSAYWMSHWEIKLPRWARQPVVVLHECAHMIQIHLLKWPDRRTAPHGREFAGVQMFLLNRYLDIPFEILMQTANEDKVDFVSQSTYKEVYKQFRKSNHWRKL